MFVSRLLADGHDPMAVRLAVLAHHYRDDWDWTAAGAGRGGGPAWPAGRSGTGWLGAAASLPAAEAVLAGVPERLADDLDAPGAWLSWTAGPTTMPGGDQDGAGPAPAAAPSPAARLVRDTVDALLGVKL